MTVFEFVQIMRELRTEQSRYFAKGGKPQLQKMQLQEKRADAAIDEFLRSVTDFIGVEKGSLTVGKVEDVTVEDES